MERCPVALDPTGRDIHSEAAGLRAQGPAVPVELPGGVVIWSVNRYDIAKQLLSDPRITKSARTHWPAFISGEVPPNWELISWVAMDNIATAWGKDHLRLRKLTGYAFTRRRIEALRPRITELVNELIDGLEADPGDIVDLKSQFAAPLPARLVADMIGMPEEARAKTAAVIDMMVDTTVTPQQAQGILEGWRGSMADLIAAKRAQPTNDITSDLIAARDDEDGSRLSESELTDTIFAILGAGSETTINFLDNAITALLAHPEQRDLVATGQASWAQVIEETLRVQSPLAHLPMRYAVEDIQLGDVTIPQGDPIIINYCALGRDPALHSDDPDSFDITRSDKEHISFGFGPHFCLGAGVARLVGEIGLSTLFSRFPEMSLAVPEEELVPLPTFIMNGHRSLPVRLRAGIPAEAGARS